MKTLLTVLGLVALGAVLPVKGAGLQGSLRGDWGGSLDLISSGDLTTYCDQSRVGGDCGSADVSITLTGSMDIEVLPAGAGQGLGNSESFADVVGAVVMCAICLDGSCNSSVFGSAANEEALLTYSYHTLTAGELNRVSFEHYYTILGTGRDRTASGVGLRGPGAYNSYTCRLKLHATSRDGVESLETPSDTYDPGQPSTRWALAQSGVVSELSGPLN